MKILLHEGTLSPPQKGTLFSVRESSRDKFSLFFFRRRNARQNNVMGSGDFPHRRLDVDARRDFGPCDKRQANIVINYRGRRSTPLWIMA